MNITVKLEEDGPQNQKTTLRFMSVNQEQKAEAAMGMGSSADAF